MIINTVFVVLSVILSVQCMADYFKMSRRRGRTLFHEDQDVIITMVIIFPYYFPLWERFYNTSVEQGTDAAIAQFPNIPPGGLPSCGALCRKKRSQMGGRSGRFFQYDEQVIHFMLEMIAAFPVPIIPNPYAAANRKPMRVTDGFNPLPGFDGLRELAGLFGLNEDEPIRTRNNSSVLGPTPQGIDDIGIQAPIGLFDGPTNRPNRRRPIRFGSLGPILPTQGIDNIGIQQPIISRVGRTDSEEFGQKSNTNGTEVRNLCVSSQINFHSSRSLEENCFMNSKNSRLLSAYETVSIDRKRMVSQMRLNLSSVMAAMSCHFAEWYLKKRVNYFVRSFFLGTIKTICTNSNLVHFFGMVHKLCKCLMLKNLI